jgi:cobalt-zinc-cadmium efflux system protein
MGHGHAHGAGRATDRSRLRTVLALTVAVLLAEVLGAWWSGSLALLADAGHLATDAGALTLALAASYMATRPASNRLPSAGTAPRSSPRW